jgi:hypothetical protein
VFCFTDVLTPAQLIELAQRTERLGYAALWYPEVLGYESFALGSFLLSQTSRLIIASGIANIYGRDATAAKQGPAHPGEALRQWRGKHWRSICPCPVTDDTGGASASLRRI